MEDIKLRKRQLVSIACASCQSKHRACGAERPCYHCVRLGIECVAGEPKKKPRKKLIKPPSPPSSSSPLSSSFASSSPSSSSSSSFSSSSSSPSSSSSSPLSVPSESPSLLLVSPPPLSYPSSFSSLETPNFVDDINNFNFNINNLLSNDSISFVEQFLFSSLPYNNNNSNNTINNTNNYNNDNNFNDGSGDILSLPSPLSPSLPSMSIPSSPFSPLSSSSSSPSPLISPLTSKDDQINELQLEVIRLRKQLEKKESPEKPLMVAMATMVFSLPNGELVDYTTSLFIILNIPKKNFSNFDDITPEEERPKMHALRRKIVNEKMTFNQMGTKTLMMGNGAIGTYRSCCYMLHFDGYAILHSTIWCAN